ncbi:hypothetical protein SERLA73DRAFT_174216, partial [Serpula lacrymans var. lacrymans S7.3]
MQRVLIVERRLDLDVKEQRERLRSAGRKDGERHLKDGDGSGDADADCGHECGVK